MRARNDENRRLFSRDDLTSTNILLYITDTKGIDQEKLNTALKNRDAGSVDTSFWKWERVQELLELFEEAKTFGSLISIPDEIAENLSALQSLVDATPGTIDDLFLGDAENELNHLKPVLNQATLLSKNMTAWWANPPYMGTKGMNPMLKKFAGNHFPDSKSDLFAIFIERNLDLAVKYGFVGMITMQSWMFLSSFEKLREKILTQNTIHSMAHLGARGFDSIGGEVVSTTAFIMEIFLYQN